MMLSSRRLLCTSHAPGCTHTALVLSKTLVGLSDFLKGGVSRSQLRIWNFFFDVAPFFDLFFSALPACLHGHLAQLAAVGRAIRLNEDTQEEVLHLSIEPEGQS